MLQGDEEELQVSAGRSQFMLRPYRAGDFPHLPTPSGASVSLSTAGLAEALRQVVRAASSEDTRPVLTGVLMAAEAEGLRLVATDSYRLAVKDLPGAKGVLGEGQKVLVPSRALASCRGFSVVKLRRSSYSSVPTTSGSRRPSQAVRPGSSKGSSRLTAS